jgi:hypothetical protein
MLQTKMHQEATHEFTPFLVYVHEFDFKKAHMMLALMFHPIFKDELSIANNYVGK